MSFRRYLIAVDTSRPTAVLDRYLAPFVALIPDLEASLVRYRRNAADGAPPGASGGEWSIDWNVIVEEVQDRIYQLRALQQRLATTDLFSPTQWAAADAADLANATAATMPERLRVFLSAPHENTDQFVQYADREAALASLARAQSVTPQQIAAMPTAAAQSAAVTEMWRNFAAYFRALNLRPWGWSRYRARIDSCWGIGRWGDGRGELGTGAVADIGRQLSDYALMIGAGVSGLFGPAPRRDPDPSSAFYNSITFGPAGYDRLLKQRPIPVDVFGGIGGPGSPAWRSFPGEPVATSSLPNNWRTEAWWRCKQFYSNALIGGSTPSSVRFGTPEAVSRSRMSRSSLLGGSEPDVRCNTMDLATSEADASACLGPSGDVYRLWLTNAATLGGGVSYDPACFTTQRCFDHIDCVRRSLSNGLTTGPNPIGGPPGPNWMCGGVDHDSSWLYYLPPDLWYAMFLWPMIQYLASRDPLEIIYEVYLDVSGKNMFTSFATNNGARTIAGLTSDRTTASAFLTPNQVFASMQRGLGTAAGIGGSINPTFGAVAGLASSAAGLMRQIVPASETGTLDEVGRHEPALEYLPIVPETRETHRAEVASKLGLNPSPQGATVPIAYHGNELRFVPPPSRPQSFAWISDPSTYAAQAGIRVQDVSESSEKFALPDEAIVRIVGMPRGGGVYLDGSSTPIDGQWEAGSDATVWVVPVPYGSHTLAVRSPDGQVRSARVSLNSGQTLTGEFQTMQPVMPETPQGTTGMSGAAKAGVAVLAIGAIGGGAYVFRKKLGLEPFFRKLSGKR